ncbi:MAG: VWA domain-containing protein [Chloroflexi bacterium]|nr:VWA domain-containing protein [Chloroflexota bacterium]
MRKLFAFASALILNLVVALTARAQGPVNITVTQIDQSRFPQVDVYVSATDAARNPVRNLSPDVFRLTQNGKPVNLTAATRAGEQGAVNTVLVIDHSGSMARSDKMAGAKQAASNFVNLMRPGDKAALIQFDTDIETLQPLTGDKNALVAAIQKIAPRGNTALYDALAQGGKYFETTEGRKAIIVVTDGMDNASKLNRDAAVKQAEQGSYTIYTIGLGNKAAGFGSQEGIDEAVLRDLASASMGTYAYTPDASQLSALYEQLSVLIQNEYKLTYLSPDPLRDGLRREIVVTAPGASQTQAAYNPGGLIPEIAPQWSSWALFLIALLLLLALFFAPTGLRLAAARFSPNRVAVTSRPSRVKLTSAAESTSGTSRPTRVKVGKKTSGAAHDMPWDE